MRPNVFDQIMINQVRMPSQEPQPNVRAAPGRPSGQRGPWNRPIYRLWEYATWRARMRAWCNQIKAALLQEEHDPTRPQTYRVIQATACPVDSPSTWLSWWEGAAIPRPSHIATAEKLAPHSSELLDITERRTCLSRHLSALDVLNTKFRMAGGAEDYRRTQAERLIAGLNEAWSSFLETSVPRRKPSDVLNELGHSADCLFGDSCTVDSSWAEKFGGNPARWALPL